MSEATMIPEATPSVWSDGAMTITEAARFLGVSSRSIYNLIDDGDLERAKVRGRAVVPRRGCLNLLESGRTAA